MILKKTGDSLERSNRINHILTVLIILLVLLLAGSLLTIRAKISKRSAWQEAEIEGIDRIEQRIAWNGLHQGLEVWSFGPYGLADDSAHRERWALSEYYGERFLENAWRHVGNNAEADAAHARAVTWSEETGSLSAEEAEALLRTEVWP